VGRGRIFTLCMVGSDARSRELSSIRINFQEKKCIEDANHILSLNLEKKEVVFMGIKFLKISVIYFLIGIGFGMFMAISHKFQYAPSHAHINLLGWASMALAGIIYYLFPSLAQKSLGKVHFWLHNVGLPIMMIGLILLEAGNSSVEPVIAFGASIMSIGIVCFVVNVLVNLKDNTGETPQ
jgi:hypothetical protein